MNPILKILSRRNWGILRYNSILQNLTILFYIAYTGRLWNLAFIGQVALFFVFSTLMTGFGYLINDLADIDLDRRHGKPNAFSSMSRLRARLIVSAILICGGFFSLPFLRYIWFVIIWLIWIFAATFYSLPPLRLKERSIAGLATTVLAQQTLPAALLFTAFNVVWSWDILVFLFFVTMRGLSSDIGHQFRDWSHDSLTGTDTFAVRVGLERARFIYMICLEIERLALGAVLVVLWLNLPWLELPSFGRRISSVLPLVLIYLAFLIKTIGRSWHSWRKGFLEENDPYDEVRQARQFDADHFIHHTFPTVLVPLYLACLITVAYLPNIIFVLMIVLVFNLYRPALWKRLLPIRLIGSKFQSLSGIVKKHRS